MSILNKIFYVFFILNIVVIFIAIFFGWTPYRVDAVSGRAIIIVIIHGLYTFIGLVKLFAKEDAKLINQLYAQKQRVK
jgi:ABC-type multidrug transport system permease subunit